MPAACSAAILLALVGPRALVRSSSMPGKRLGKTSPITLRSSALAGIAATSLPSFLAASTVFSHSDENGGRASPEEAGDEISDARRIITEHRRAKILIRVSRSVAARWLFG